MKPKFCAALFDLDGTLVDSLADLAHATNHALTQLGCPTHPLAAYRHFVGDGARVLCERALPANQQHRVEEARQLLHAYYDKHWADRTQPYPGIRELITALTARGYKLAVFSNKPDDFTKRMVGHFFCSRESHSRQQPGQPRESLTATSTPFAAVRGQLADVPLKPDPTGALQIAQELGIPPAEWIYLGDTNTDMRTARSAGMFAVGVLWGFRDEAELREAGAQTIIARPEDALQLL